MKFGHGFTQLYFTQYLFKLRLVHSGEEPPVYITKLSSEAGIHHLKTYHKLNLDICNLDIQTETLKTIRFNYVNELII